MVSPTHEKYLRELAEKRSVNDSFQLATNEVHYLINRIREKQPVNHNPAPKSMVDEIYNGTGAANEKDLRERVNRKNGQLTDRLQRFLNDVLLLAESEAIESTDYFWDRIFEMEVFVSATDRFMQRSEGIKPEENSKAWQFGYDLGLAFRMLLGSANNNNRSSNFLAGFIEGQFAKEIEEPYTGGQSDEYERLVEVEIENSVLADSQTVKDVISNYYRETDRTASREDIHEMIRTMESGDLEEIISLKNAMDEEINKLEEADAPGVQAEELLTKLWEQDEIEPSSDLANTLDGSKITQVSQSLNKLAKNGRNRSPHVTLVYEGGPIVDWDDKNNRWTFTQYGKLLMTYMLREDIEWLYEYANDFDENAFEIHGKEFDLIKDVLSTYSFDEFEGSRHSDNR